MQPFLIAFKQLHRDISLTHTLQLEQQVKVKDLKPAIVKMYDYYQTSKDVSHTRVCVHELIGACALCWLVSHSSVFYR